MNSIKIIELNADGDIVEKETGVLLAVIEDKGFEGSEFAAEIVKRFNNGGNKNERNSLHACGCGRVHGTVNTNRKCSNDNP
jgi:hypothetical protein